jgi:uncharacterized protein YbjT (DUF2867 family)
MQITLTTPTGHVGSHLVRALVTGGVRPRVLARPSSAVPLEDHVDVVRVDDLADAEAVTAATAGTDALYWCSPSPDLTGDDDPLEHHAQLAASLAAAVTANAIPRVVFQSSVGAELRHGAGEIDGLAATEVALDRTGTAVTHLRCGYFMTNLLLSPDDVTAGRLDTLLPVDSPMAWVAPRDIAEVAAVRLVDPSWTGRHVCAVHGPEDLTWTAAAAVLSEVLGQVVTARQAPDDSVRASLASAGMTAAQVSSIVDMSVGMRDGFVPEQPRDATTTTPTTLRSWAVEELVPLVN